MEKGQKYGKLLILDKAYKKNYVTYWNCLCDCGTIKAIREDHLKRGETKSCGCVNRERMKKIGKERAYLVAGNNRIDIAGKRFGRLTAIKVFRMGDKKHSEEWLCRCDCGAMQIVNKSNLLSKHTTSCGCKMSKFETKVAEILFNNNIHFTKNKTFCNCKFNNGRPAKFDFYVENKYIIECDGKEHLTKNRSTYEYDLIKNNWCLSVGIPLIRIPHEGFEKLTIKDLLLETTPFLISKS